MSVLSYTFTPELQNKSSQAFKETEKNFTSEVSISFLQLRGRCRVKFDHQRVPCSRMSIIQNNEHYVLENIAVMIITISDSDNDQKIDNVIFTNQSRTSEDIYGCIIFII